MGRRVVVRAPGSYYLPQIETGLRQRIAGLAERIPSFGAAALASLDHGKAIAITSAKVEDSLLRSGDHDSWRRWRNEHQSGDRWQPGGEGDLWIYDPRTATLRPAD